jgi:uncharacterized protein (TIGR03083 family)
MDSTTALALIHRFADTLDDLDADRFDAPNPCSEWTVADLSRHVATGLFTAAEAFHRARFGSADPPSEITGAIPADALVSRIRLAASHLDDALRNGPGRWPDIGLRFGRHPFDVAVACLVIEYGVHCNDLDRATGDPQAPLPRAAVEALFGFGAHYLLLQADPLEASEAAPLTFTLRAPSASMSIGWDGARWHAGARPGVPECVITGTDDDIARLMLRRLDVDTLDLDDPHALAGVFPAAVRPL